MSAANLAFFISIIAGLHGSAAGQNATITYVTVSTLKLTPTISSPLPFKYGESKFVTFNYSFVQQNMTVYPKKGWIVSASVDNGNVATINGRRTFYIDFKQSTGNITLEVKGDNAGRSHLRFHIKDWIDYPFGASKLRATAEKMGTQIYTDVAVQMYVTMQTRTIDTLFNIVVFLLVITANIGMGTQVDLNIVKEQLRLPIAPAIGLFSQFVFMPVIAFSVAVGLEVEPGIALGLFACGCAPGGLASNIFTWLLHGNISLSITMTLVSTLASLGLLPFWLFTLGTYLYSDSDIKIPFRNIIVSLFIIIIPAVIGLFMQAKTPRAALLLIKATKIIMGFFLVFMFTFGTYANWWVLDLVDGKILFASAALPYLGFLLGGFSAFVGRRSTPDIVTIAVETGIQNTAVPIVLLRMSLKGPEMTTSIVVPLISSTLTPIPLVIAVIYIEIRDHLRRKHEAEQRKDTPADQVALEKEEEAKVNFEEPETIQEEEKTDRPWVSFMSHRSSRDVGIKSAKNTPVMWNETQL